MKVEMVGSDMLYIKFRDSKVKETRMLSEDAYIDLGNERNLVGIEIWRAFESVIILMSKKIIERIKATPRKLSPALGKQMKEKEFSS